MSLEDQIGLTNEQKASLFLAAKRRGVSVPSLLRQLVARLLEQEKSTREAGPMNGLAWDPEAIAACDWEGEEPHPAFFEKQKRTISVE